MTAALGRVGTLVGDVTGNGSVNAADIVAVKARNGQSPASGNNYLFDLNLDGAINGADVSAAKARSGKVLP